MLFYFVFYFISENLVGVNVILTVLVSHNSLIEDNYALKDTFSKNKAAETLLSDSCDRF